MNYDPGSLIQLKATGAIYMIVERCRVDFRYNAPRGLHGGDCDLNRLPDDKAPYLKLVSPIGEIEYARFREIVNNDYDPMREDWILCSAQYWMPGSV